MNKPLPRLLAAASLSLLATTASAQFVNGGFEDGTTSGWSVLNGSVSSGPAGGLATPSFPLAGSPLVLVTNPGTDSLTNGNLQTVFNGTHSVRINDANGGNNATRITQTIANYTNSSIFFAWAAVLNDPQHNPEQQPGFSLRLRDVTAGSDVFSLAFRVNQGIQGLTWRQGQGDFFYTGWNVVQLDVSSRSGNTFQLEMTAWDCTLGGHGGYAYLDAFGSAALQPTSGGVIIGGDGTVNPGGNGVPEPGALSLMLGMIGVMGFVARRRKLQA